MNIKKEIKKAIRHGIYMGYDDEEEEQEFMNELFSFLINKKNFCTYKDNDKTIVVSSDSEDLGEIYIHSKTLKITPLTEVGFFKVFMDMLEFLLEQKRKGLAMNVGQAMSELNIWKEGDLKVTNSFRTEWEKKLNKQKH